MTNWDHWLLYNIPSYINNLKKDLRAPPQGTQVGKNTWNQLKYSGPCPPESQQTYIFTLFALNEVLPVKGALTRSELEIAMKPYILCTAELIGHYKRAD